ncbi:type I polyketide synthase, partial [Actinomadura rupiterrae]|uniref:type I polyketide synthase n=1 Tax=Actinomadura rupiterrae TaxID=559627 RepID=UPI0020A4E482
MSVRRDSKTDIAVVGLSCRLPGASGPQEFWRLLRDAESASGDTPPDRAVPQPPRGLDLPTRGGFIEDADLFDAGFFGISPREAEELDPQQRLLLELAWEALEHSGTVPGRLSGTDAGVFVGAMAGDYAELVAQGDLRDIDKYAMTGTARGLLANRLSYFFGFHGPSLSVDTAQSSSLVAVHLACESLRKGESTLALAGGVQLNLTPSGAVAMHELGALSPDARCYVFDERANGTVRGEGGALVVLKTLDQALADGDTVHAVIRGSAVNSDGATDGLATPSAAAQQAVIRGACVQARVDPEHVQYVELHGTGTAVGDPIEAAALAAVFGPDRDAGSPLLVGSVKTNLGHLGGAAGIAGLLKVVLALKERTIPASLHFVRANPRIPLRDWHLDVAASTRDWPSPERRLLAGVSSFGMGGTNVHMIVEESPAAAARPAVRTAGSGERELPVVPWVLSAKSAGALSGQARKLADFAAGLEGARRAALDVGWSLVSGRSVFDHRAVVLAGTGEGLVEGLQSLVSGVEHPGVVVGAGAEPLGGRVLVFGGQGSQWLGMGRELLGSSPVFAASISEVEEAFEGLVGWSLTDTLRGSGPGVGDVGRVDVVQPVLFAVMVSLARLWKWMGVEPDAVVGHSQGEIAAACVAGALSLQDAARVVVLRSQVLAGVAGRGGMAAVSAPVEQVGDWLTGWDGRLEIAAVNGPSSVVVSGDAEPVAEFVDWCEQQGTRARRLAVDYASHCSQMEPLREPILDALGDVQARSVSTAFYSTVTGGRIDTAELDAAYWFENLRRRVRFEDASRALLADGFRAFIEATPHPSLVTSIHDTAEESDSGPVVAVGSLRRDRGGLDQFLTSVAQAFVAGVEVDWAQVFEETGASWTDLPTYAFDRRRYWTNKRSLQDVTGVGLASVEHPLLGAAVELPDGGGVVLTGRLSMGESAWLADHVVLGHVLFPGTGFVEAAIRAGDQVGAGHVRELTLHAPLPLSPEQATQLHVMVTPAPQDGDAAAAGEGLGSASDQRPDAEGREWRVAIYSRPDGRPDHAWTLHADGVLSGGGIGAENQWDTAWPPEGAAAVDLTDAYDRLAARGHAYGPGFQGLAGVWRRGSEVYVEAALPEALRDEASRFGLHPVLLDAVLQAGLVTDVLGEGTVLPHQWHGLALHACGAATVRARLAPHGPDGLSVTIIDPAGQLVLTADSLVTRPIDPASLSDAFSGSGALYHLEWIPAERSSAAELAEDVVALSLAETGIDGELPDGPATVLLRCRTAVASDDEPALEDLVCEVLSVVQQWLARADEDARLIVVTSGAVGWEQDEVRDLAGAAVWGLVRSAQSENPGRIVLVDVPDWETPDSAVLEVASLDEPQCALRDDQVWVPRLRRSSETDSADGVTAVADTLLITGGTGRRGALAARHAVQRWGARDLVLASPRDTADDAIGELVTELEQLGAQVRVVTCDVADRSAVAELVAGIRAGGGRVSGVVHAADDPEDAEASGATPDRVRAVLAAKARGAWNLHLETLPDEPSLFVMFSSVAGILGSMGQADHAAADAFLDALAWHRRASGLPAVSLVWGADGTDQARPRQDSPPLLTADRGLELLDAALATGRPVSVLAQVDIAYLQASPTVPRLLADLVAVRRTAASQGNFGRRGLQEQLAAVKPDRRLQMVLDLVRAHAAAGLGHAASGDIDPGQTFRDLGFDSLGAVEFRNRLSAAAGVRLPSTVTFDYPTPSLMAQFLLAELVDGFAADASTVAGRPVADADEPVAIVGMSCRFPGGVVSPEGLWDLVAKGRDVISEFPENRGWDVAGIFDPEPGVPGKSYTRRGGFLDGAGEFDAGFFGISPREAVGMDPQQRLLLEAVWEAFERAGIDPAGLRGSSTGVFAGLMAQDYGDGVGGTEADGYGLTGSTTSVASGRVSYVLGLEGPAVTVDTACSSSLVALHLACQSVRSGESELAVAGGVTVMASPGMFVEFSRQRGLAPDGRCKSFGEGADGTAWAEGVGVVVVERLSEARRLGHRVLAVVRGSAINQDGASNGLTAPNGPSQQRVIRQALANAGLGVTDVDVVEAHGTGTSLGDPIEAQALLATYGQRPVDGPPLWLGSLKSNLGHAQAAAGIAGVIKMVQALHHDTLPATLHADEPSSHVDWDAGRVRLLTEAQSWPADHVRRAAVSSFGISGTNAHVILEQPPATRPVDAGGLEMPVVPWILSAKSQRALSGQARRLLDYAAERGLDTADGTAALADVGWSLVSGRSVFDHRAVVLAGAGEGLVEGLQSLVSGAEHPGVVTGSGAGSLGGRVLVFGGQGSQWLGMGRELLESSPVFAASISECEEAFGGLVDWFLTETLRGSGPRAGDLNRVDVVQPVLFAVMVSLARLWKWIGVEPDAVVGHSQGEIAAACVAGALSLQDAARVVVLRSQVLAEVAGRGGMAAVSASVEQVTDWLTRWDGWLEVAAVNGPSSVVVSGDADPVAEFVDWCEGDGVRARRLAVDYASHCSQMEPLREPILDALQGISPQSVSTAFYSTVTGGRIDTVELDGAYWFENLRRQVRFDDASRALLADGFRVFIEATPHPSLVTSIHDTAEASDSGPVVAVGSLRRDRGGLDQFLTSVAQAFVAGVEVDWKQIFEGTGAAWTDLPTYAFDHRHYWLNGRSGHDVSGVGQSAVEHPLLGAAVELPDGGGVVLTGRLSTGVDTWLADHAVHGQVIFPGTGFVEATIRAGDQVGASHLRELTLHNPLLLTKEHATRLHVMLTPLSQGQHGAASTGGEWRAAIYSRPDGGEDHPWILHAEGVLGTEPGDAGAPVTSDAWTAWPPVDADPVDLSQAYEGLAEQGYEYGPVFQGLAGVWRRGSEVFVEAALPERARNEASRFGLHPALLDAVLHAALLTDVIEGPDADGRIALPYCWNQVALHASGAATVRARLAPEGPDGLSVTVVDPSGQPVLTADSLLTRPIDPARLRQAPSAADWLYHLAWTPAGTDAPADDGRADEGDELLTLVVSGTDSATDLPERPPATMLVHCRPSSSLKPDEVADSAETIVCQVLGVLQWWLARSDEDARLIVVTSGAVGWEQDEVRDLAGAAVWGLVRSAQSENPGRITLLDVPDWDTPIPALVTAGMPGESQYVVRDEQLWIPRLQRPNTGDLVTPEDGAHDATPTIDSGSLVITGGTGGLGVVVARHAVERWGVRDVVLVSRRGPEAEGIEEVLAELRSLGAQARAVACDVSDRDAVRELVGGIRAGGGRVAGVVHAAGVLHDGVVETLPADRVQVVLAAKARAAWNLHQETLDDEPGLFVMFSSVAGVLGLAGQAGYAAANTFLDALAWHRRAQGLPATSLAWGLWASPSGMTSHLDTTDQARLQRNGVLPLPTAQGLELLDIGVRAERPVLVPARLDLASFSGAAAMPPMLAGLVRSRRAVASQTEGASGDSLRTRLAGLDADRRLPVVLDLVRAHAAAVLGHAAGVEIDPGQAFRDLGFDSLGAVEFRNRLSAAAGVRLPSTMTFDYPTPELLARFLLAQVVDDAPASAEATPLTGRSSAQDDEPVAIVGMSCRFPGGVVSPEGLWDLVAEGRDVISEFPDDRGWDVAGIFDPEPGVPGKSYTRWGGFLEAAGEFDAGFFGISPREAMGMDPQQRLLLEAVWEAFERAGIDPAGLRGTSTGVFAGLMAQEYGVGIGGTEVDGYGLTGSTASVASGRVSYVLGLEGPAVTIDTACSSSLVALHLACQSVRSGESELAVAGGVTVMASSEMFVEFSRQRGLAPDGRCKSFGEGADGTAWAEGVGVVVVERLSEARRLGHRVLAVVRGSAVNQDGASNGLTAPNGPSQQRVIRQALANSGLGIEDVDVVEAHGTGTSLGDPIEAQALLATYGQRPADGPPLWLGSLKSNMGHAQAAAGVAGVIKMVQALHHDTLPATLHADEPSSHVDWDAGHVRLLTEAQPWPADHVRRAAVSSFGISGTNAHVIIEQPPSITTVVQETPGTKLPVLPWVLSAKSPRALSGQARNLLDHAAGRGMEASDGAARALVDVGWSLVSGRSVFDHRAVVLGEDGQELLAGLRSVAEKPADELAGPVVSGVARAGRSVVVFPGQGSQWLGMGRGLYEAYGVFAEAFDQVISELESCLKDDIAPGALREVVWGEDADLLNQTLFTQAGLFAVEVALFRLVEAWGLRPDFVLGHSVGEIAAAHVAGVLSLADAARLVAARGRLMQALPTGGAMAAVQADEAQVTEFLTAHGLADVGIAAVNAPGSIVVSGA